MRRSSRSCRRTAVDQDGDVVVDVFSSPFLIHSQPAGRLEVFERPARRPRSPVAPALRRPASRRCPAKVDDSSSDGHVSFSLVLCSFTSLFLDLDRYHYVNSASPAPVASPSVAAFRPLSATENVAQSRTVRIPASHPPGKGSHRLNASGRIFSATCRSALPPIQSAVRSPLRRLGHRLGYVMARLTRRSHSCASRFFSS